MMKRKICEFLTVFLIYIIQITLGSKMEIGGIKPNLLLILPIVFGYLNGKNEGIYVGFIAGLLYDIQASSLLGFSSLVFSLAGYLSGIFYELFEQNNFFIPLIITFITDLLYETFSYVGNFMLHNRLDFLYFFERFIAPECIYTASCVIILFWPFRFLNKKFEKKERHEKRSGSYVTRSPGSDS